MAKITNQLSLSQCCADILQNPSPEQHHICSVCREMCQLHFKFMFCVLIWPSLLPYTLHHKPRNTSFAPLMFIPNLPLFPGFLFFFSPSGDGLVILTQREKGGQATLELLTSPAPCLQVICISSQSYH